jgi:hypothetical protein
MRFVRRNAQDKSSTRVVLLDEPSLRNGNGKRTQLGDGAMAGDVRDAETRPRVSTAIAFPRDPAAHRDAKAATADQREEPERCRSLVVVICDPGYQVNPTVSGDGKPFHARDDLADVVDAELHSLGLP